VKFLSLILIILLQIYFAGTSIAQQTNIRKYSIEDGLVNNDVLNIYQDSLGFIWLCTRGGLSRYDGNRFTNYTTGNGLTGDMINAVYEIAPQQFIVAQNSGGPRLLYNGAITSFGDDTQITLNRFYKDNSNRLLVATDQSGIMYLQNGRFIPVNNGYKISTQRMSKINDSLWIVMQQQEAAQLLTTPFNIYSKPTPLKITTIYTDLQKHTWVGTKKGLMLLAPQQQCNKPIAFALLPALFNLPILRESYIADMMQDSRGDYWIATNTGLVHLKSNGKYQIFTDTDGLPSPSVNCLLEDNQHNMWIGTPLGLAKFSLNNEVKIFTQKDGLSMKGVGFLAAVTENKVLLFEDDSIKELDLQERKISVGFLKTDSTLNVYKLNSPDVLAEKTAAALIYKQVKSDSKISNWPVGTYNCVAQVSEGIFVGAVANKLFTVTNGRVQQQLLLNIPDIISVVVIDKKGVLWAGTVNSGLYKIALHKCQDTIAFKIIDTLVSTLPDAHIRALYADKENELWIGTRYQGLVRLLQSAGEKYTIQQYGIDQGLSSDFVRTINRDATENIWAGTMQGIDKLIPQNDGYRVFNFGKVNNIFSQVFDICFLKDGYLLAAGFPYLVYARDVQQDTLKPAAVYITKVYTANADSATNAGTIVPYNKAQINFEFSAPQFINEKITTYTYRLLGSNDTNWTAAGKSQLVYYASLRPGGYTFEVKAMGFDGKWGQPAFHRFVVTTPFWQQAWFIILMMAIVALLGYAFYRYRIRQLIRLQKVRNSIATDLHDEIGSNLTNISILSNLSKKNLSQPQQAGEFLQRISEEVAASSQALDDIIWSVNTSHDTLDETVSRMRRYAAELFDAAGISYDLQLNPLFEEKKLTMEQRRDVYLVYKEAVNNIFKHAAATQVIIKINIEQQQLVLQIKDNGKGFDTTKTSARYGLKGMRERVQKWKGKFEISSANNTGTSIKIALPLAT
jgi:signal transduction histidine kinase/ligand-binding sensor domain-containing protein